MDSNTHSFYGPFTPAAAVQCSLAGSPQCRCSSRTECHTEQLRARGCVFPHTHHSYHNLAWDTTTPQREKKKKNLLIKVWSFHKPSCQGDQGLPYPYPQLLDECSLQIKQNILGTHWLMSPFLNIVQKKMQTIKIYTSHTLHCAMSPGREYKDFFFCFCL